MKIAGTIYPAYNGYDGIAFEIYISGCNQHCAGCHNPEMQSFDVGQDVEEVFDDLELKIQNALWADYISFLGGEPLNQEGYEFMVFVTSLKARFKSKRLMLFTGHDFDDIPAWCFDMFDVIKHGKYDETMKCEGFPASLNQGVWRKHGRLDKNEIPTQ